MPQTLALQHNTALRLMGLRPSCPTTPTLCWMACEAANVMAEKMALRLGEERMRALLLKYLQ